MSVDCLKNFSLDEVRRARIDFTSGGTVTFGLCASQILSERCTVLQADKIRYGDKSTTGSPISSHRGSSVHHDSSSGSSASSGSPMASPVSYTQDLIGVDSPGLSGGAGALTPVKREQCSPMVPRQVVATRMPEDPRLRPAAAAPAAAQHAPPPPLPPRKSRFDVKPEDLERAAKTKKEAAPSLLPNGKRKAESEEESKDEEEEDEEPVDPRRMGSLGLFVKRIKLETLSTSVSRPPPLPPLPSPPSLVATVKEAKPPPPPPLLPRAVATSAAAATARPLVSCLKRSKIEVEEESSDDEPAFGPQLPKNGEAKKAPVIGPSLLGASSSSSAATTGAASSLVVKAGARKRLLSERGEKELSYPVMEKEISSKWGWEGATWVSERKRGVGLINRANDCFLNVILQMVTHTAPLARYLMERHRSDCKREQGACVACALRDRHLAVTFRQAAPMETRWITPHLKRIFPSHAWGAQEDAHELLSLLLDAIDPPPGWNRENGNKELPTNKLKPSTPIEQIFGGTLRNQVTCQSCHTPFINYERIRELNVALGRKQEERIPLSTLVQDYFKNETISAFACKKCARKTQAVRQTRVLRAPAVLIVQLKRFNAYGGKIRQPILAEKELDLTKWTFDAAAAIGDSSSEAGVKSTGYTLTGVVEHLGSTVDHGHYIAYVKSLDNQCWFKFDDEEITKTPGHSNNAYLLFYSRKDLRSTASNKNGQSAAAAASSSFVPSGASIPSVQPASKLVMNGGGQMKMSYNNNNNGGGGAASILPGLRPQQHQNGGGFGKPGGGYQNGNGNQKMYGNGGGYNGSNKFHNHFNKPYQPYGNNKWNNGGNNSNNGGGRPIKTFPNNQHNKQQYSWNSRQHI